MGHLGQRGVGARLSRWGVVTDHLETARRKLADPDMEEFDFCIIEHAEARALLSRLDQLEAALRRITEVRLDESLSTAGAIARARIEMREIALAALASVQAPEAASPPAAGDEGCERHRGDPHNLCEACWAAEVATAADAGAEGGEA